MLRSFERSDQLSLAQDVILYRREQSAFVGDLRRHVKLPIERIDLEDISLLIYLRFKCNMLFVLVIERSASRRPAPGVRQRARDRVVNDVPQRRRGACRPSTLRPVRRVRHQA